MITKYILHGGNSSRPSEDNRKFFLEIINSIDVNKIKILCIYFARPQHRWEESFEEDKKIFFSLNSPKEIVLQLALPDQEKLSKEITSSDVVFINGGMRGNLKETLEGLGNFSDLIKGKVVVGISAGANIMSKYYYSSVAQGIREGIGLLPIKLFCHYSEKNILESEQLNKYKEFLEIYNIPEEKFSVIEVKS